MDKAQQNLEILEQYFRDGCKLNCVQKLGLEIEHFLVREVTLEAAAYSGPRGIESLLEELAHPVSPAVPGGRTATGTIQQRLCPEPGTGRTAGGQHRTPRKSADHPADLRNFSPADRPLLARRGWRLVTLGYQPKSRAEELSLIPKRRYEYMDAYFKRSGTRGRNMMRGTAATQVFH